MLMIDVAVLAILAGTVLPILVGVVTKKLAAGGIKAAVLAGLSIVTGLVNGAVNADGVFTQEALVGAGVAWVTAVATYYGFLKPTGITEKVADKALPGVGIGRPVEEGDASV